MTYATAHSSWILNRVVELDRRCPRFCGEFFRMSDERRHVVAAFFAQVEEIDALTFEVGEFLLTANHQCILAETYESVPEGLRKALRRSGRTVHDKRFYPLLHDLLSRSGNKNTKLCLSHLSNLGVPTLLIVERLPDQLRRPSFVEALNDADEAFHVRAAFELLQRHGVNEDVLLAALQSVEHPIALTKAFRRLVEHAEAPAHPVPATNGYEPLRTGRDLNRAAREFRNCLRAFTTRFLNPSEGHAFAVAFRTDERAVVHLVRSTNGAWKLEGMFGHRNRRPSPPLRQQVAHHLRSHGIEFTERTRRHASGWNSLRRMMNENMLGFDFGGDFDDALDGLS